MANQGRRRKYSTWLQPSPERNPSRPFEVQMPRTSKWRLISQPNDPGHEDSSNDNISEDEGNQPHSEIETDDEVRLNNVGSQMDVDSDEGNLSVAHSSASTNISEDDEDGRSHNSEASTIPLSDPDNLNNIDQLQMSCPQEDGTDTTSETSTETFSELNQNAFEGNTSDQEQSGDESISNSHDEQHNDSNESINSFSDLDNLPHVNNEFEEQHEASESTNSEHEWSGDDNTSISHDEQDNDSNASINSFSELDNLLNVNGFEVQHEASEGTNSEHEWSGDDNTSNSHDEQDNDSNASINSFSELDNLLNVNGFEVQHEASEGLNSELEQSGDDSSSSDQDDQGSNFENSEASEGINSEPEQSGDDSSSSDHDDQNSASDDEDFHNNPNDQPEPFYADVFETLRKKIQSKFSEVIDAQPRISPAELLLNALTLIRKFNFNFSQFEGVMKLINTIFKDCVIPDTRYKLDILLKSLSGMHYHFVCMYCKDYMGEHDHRAAPEIECPGCHRVNSVSNLNNCVFFVLFDLPPQIEVLLSDDAILRKLKRPIDLINNEQPRILRDVYDGKMYQSFISSLEDNPNINHISFCFSVDGVSLYKSSNTEVWPIFCSILELPPYERAHNLLLGGLWFGKQHVILDVFLKPFVTHCNKLSSDGFRINPQNKEMLMKGHVLCCCADAPARAGVQCIHQYGGACSCNWCLHPSEERLYRPLQEEIARRTKNEIHTDGTAAVALLDHVPNVHVNGVKGISPVLNLTSMDIVDGMILEYFHATAHGLAKTFLLAWLGEDGCGEPYYIGTPSNLKKIDDLLKCIKLPVEARKSTRLLSELKVWKGRDFENFILYTSVPALQNILPGRFLAHWNLFVQALHLLLQEELPESNIRIAQELLQRFGRETERLYPQRFLLYNLHIVSEHLAENCDNWGPCWSINGYCFEDGNRILKNKIHANLGISSQVCRSLSFDKSCAVLRAHVGTAASQKFEDDIKKKIVNSCVFVHNDKYYGAGKHKFHPSREEKFIFERAGINPSTFELKQRLVHEGCVYTGCKKSSNHYNSVCTLKDGKVVLIDKIVVSETEYQGFVIAREIISTPFSPVVNRQDSFLSKVTFVNREPFIVTPSQLKIVCCYMKLPHGEFIIKVPNIHNTS